MQSAPQLGEDFSLIMPDATIHTVGRVRQSRGDVLYEVSLPNGKEILAHLSKPLKEQGVSYEIGDELLLELTAYDFDTARILGLAE